MYVSGTVIPSLNIEVTEIEVRLAYDHNCNTAYFSGVSLVESAAIGYTYNSVGVVTAVSKAGLAGSTYTYSGTKLTSFASGAVSGSVTYTSPVSSYLPSTVTTSSVTTEYSYDSAGNVTGMVMRPAGSSSAPGLTSSSTFDSALAKMTASTDQTGEVTGYTYYTDGSMAGVTFDGVTTGYEYDARGRQSKIWVSSLAQVNNTYTAGNLTGVTVGVTGGKTTYTFTYDAFGRTTSVTAGGNLLASYTYTAKTGRLESITYGNGFVVAYEYDSLDRIEKTKYNSVDRYTYVYNGDGELFSLTDHANNVVYRYDYNSRGDLLSESQYTTAGVFKQAQYFTYNEYGDVKTASQRIAGAGYNKYTYTYRYDTSATAGDLTAVQQLKASGTPYYTYYTYDTLNRISSEQVYCDVIGGTPALALSRGYTYQNVTIGSDTQTTTLISGLQYSGLSSTGYTYTYDARGNITAVYQNNVLHASYVYDDLGQLIRENNAAANKTWVYTYDTKGNITSRKTYAYTTGTPGTAQSTDTYEYPAKSSTPTWMDLLIKYDGNYISYDGIGNPTDYYNGSAYTFTWSDGRKLTGGTKGTTSFSYTYNADGLRTQKAVGSATYNYYWNGSQLSAMTITQNNVTETLKFYYDASGAPYCFTVGNSTFFYITNLQGDIVGIADPTYGTGGFYEYDAWGRIIHQEDISSIYTHALAVNPLRYRGYIYDDETGFYYLQSRYYDPTIRRFINADGYVNANGDLVGYNMFAYCSNNPVMGYDPSGEGFLSSIKDFLDTVGDWFENTFWICGIFVKFIRSNIDSNDIWRNSSRYINIKSAFW